MILKGLIALAWRFRDGKSVTFNYDWLLDVIAFKDWFRYQFPRPGFYPAQCEPFGWAGLNLAFLPLLVLSAVARYRLGNALSSP